MLGSSGQERRSGPDDRLKDGLDAGVLAHHEDRLGGIPGVLQNDSDGLSTDQRHAPSSPLELAVFEIAQRVGGKQAVRLEERPEHRPIDSLCCDDRTALAPSHGIGRHERLSFDNRRAVSGTRSTPFTLANPLGQYRMTLVVL